jgi:hypothetical protein
MNTRLKQLLLLTLALALLAGGSRVQRSLNYDRERLGLTRVDALENAPPVLAFTTVALGGFRGLISNLLWIRATELQEQDKFFEMAQLADWITKLEPHFTQVWVQQAWNMAYNISVKFKDFSDRWNWVRRGIELLRDEGLKYNPNDLLIHRELAWFFQHKMGQNLDDANTYYKRAWYEDMSAVFPGAQPDFDELIQPPTDAARARAKLLREKFKLDPRFMKEVDARYGPLEWRLPEAHAIYWAALGLRKAKEFPERVVPDDTMTLQRVIYQSLHQSVLQGTILRAPREGPLDLGPRLALLPQTNEAYERALREEPEKNRDGIRRAQRNLLRDAVYYLYTFDRTREAARWYDYLGRNYPKDNLLDGQPGSTVATMSLDEYAFARVEELTQEGNSQQRIKLILEGLLASSYRALALGEDERAEGFARFARRVYERYRTKTATHAERTPIAPLGEIQNAVLQTLLNPERSPMPLELQDRLRTSLGLAAPTNAPAASPPP